MPLPRVHLFLVVPALFCKMLAPLDTINPAFCSVQEILWSLEEAAGLATSLRHGPLSTPTPAQGSHTLFSP